MSGSLKQNEFIVDQPISNRTVCEMCHKRILKDDIRVKMKIISHFEYFHLLCYRPKLKQYIDIASLKIRLHKSDVKIFIDWLGNWNSQFKNQFEVDLRTVNIKQVINGRLIEKKRAWLEIFKFLPAIEVIKNLERVNRKFYLISWDMELWRYFLDRDFRVNEKCSKPKLLYISHYMEACYSCKKTVVKKGFFRCLFTYRNFCTKCSVGYYTKSQIRTNYGVNPDKLGLTFGYMIYGRRITHKEMAKMAVLNYRRKRKEKLMKSLLRLVDKDHFIILLIDKIPLNRSSPSPISDLLSNDQSSFADLLNLITNYIRPCEKRSSIKRILNKVNGLLKLSSSE